MDESCAMLMTLEVIVAQGPRTQLVHTHTRAQGQVVAPKIWWLGYETMGYEKNKHTSGLFPISFLVFLLGVLVLGQGQRSSHKCSQSILYHLYHFY